MLVNQPISLSLTDLPSDFASSLNFGYKQPETAATCPNKQFRHKIHWFFLPICSTKAKVPYSFITNRSAYFYT